MLPSEFSLKLLGKGWLKKKCVLQFSSLKSDVYFALYSQVYFFLIRSNTS